jgi:hypothetical protein
MHIGGSTISGNFRNGEGYYNFVSTRWVEQKKDLENVLEYAHLQEIEKFILNGNWGSPRDFMAVGFLGSLPNECVGVVGIT